jgi:hypothetical protein
MAHATLVRDTNAMSTSALLDAVTAEGFDLETEIEELVEAALKAGDGVVPNFTGSRPREVEEHVSYAVTEALDYSSVMELLLAHLKTDAGAELRHAIAVKYAGQVADGVREAREGALAARLGGE